MAEFEKFMIFLCSGAAKAGNKKLSYRIAAQLEALGICDIGTVQNLGEQHSLDEECQKNMLFINDCRSGCVNILTHGFKKDRYMYLDVSPHIATIDFDISNFIKEEVLPKLTDKWNYSFSN
jgi:uncharacterized metal-binding protein